MKTEYTAVIDGQSAKEISNTKRTADDYKDASLTITKTDGGSEKLEALFSP